MVEIDLMNKENAINLVKYKKSNKKIKKILNHTSSTTWNFFRCLLFIFLTSVLYKSKDSICKKLTTLSEKKNK